MLCNVYVHFNRWLSHSGITSSSNTLPGCGSFDTMPPLKHNVLLKWSPGLILSLKMFQPQPDICFEFPVYIVTSNAGIRSSGYQTHTVWRRPQLDDVVLKNPQNMYCTFTVYLLFTVYIITTTTCNEYGQVNWVCLAICTNNLTWIRMDQNSDDYFLLHTWSMECFPQSTHLITFQVCESCSCSCDLCDLLCIDFLSSFWVFTTWCVCK